MFLGIALLSDLSAQYSYPYLSVGSDFPFHFLFYSFVFFVRPSVRCCYSNSLCSVTCFSGLHFTPAPRHFPLLPALCLASFPSCFGSLSPLSNADVCSYKSPSSTSVHLMRFVCCYVSKYLVTSLVISSLTLWLLEC